MIRVKPLCFIILISFLFENLVNYDKSKTIIKLDTKGELFENLVNYDKSKTVHAIPTTTAVV